MSEISKMYNNTTDTSDFQIIPVDYLIAARINSALILLENMIVALCLSLNKKLFYKQEFWLLLVCLTLNDILCGVAMMFATFIQSDILNQNRTLCIFLIVLVLISQLSMLFNVLSICVYRFILAVCADKFRFGWKIWMSVMQVTAVFVFSCVYCTIPFVVWSRRELFKTGCDMVNVFGKNLNKAYAFVCSGLLLPLTILNILYAVTFLLLRQINKKKSFKGLRRLNRRKFMADIDKTRKTTDDKIQRNRYLENNKPFANRRGKTHSDKANQQANITLSTKDTDVCRCNSLKQTVNQNLGSFKHSAFKVGNENRIRREDESQHVRVLKPSNATQEEILFMKHETPTMPTNSNKKLRNYNHRQCLILIGVILAGINVTTWPAVIISGVEGLSSSPVFPRAVTKVLFWLVFNNSLINPWLYSVQSSEFRATVRNTVRRVLEFFAGLCIH